MKKLTVKDFLKLSGVEIFKEEILKTKKISGVSTDSRTVKENELFFALKGENFDAHDFLGDVIVKKPAAIVVHKSWREKNSALIAQSGCAVIAVEDTTKALGELANVYRKKFDIPVVAIGGSNGKTTTKEMVSAVLQTKYDVLNTEGNLNNHIGVPQTLFRLTNKHDIAVIELGTNHFGELKYLCEIAEPTHALITNIGKEHLEFFGDEAGVAKEEKELFTWVREHKGFSFINSNDSFLESERKNNKKHLTYGTTAKADVRAKKILVNEFGNASFRAEYKKKEFNIQLSVPGMHNVINALSAIAVGLKFQVNEKKIAEALKNFISANKRMQVLRHSGYTILNDTYNSNPDSVVAALNTLQSIANKGKKIAVLGDMRELGDASKREHTNIGAIAAGMNLDALFTFGHLSKYTSEAFGERGYHFNTKTELIVELQRILKNFDVVLVKGSRGMKMEEVVNQLLMQNL